MNMGYPQMDSSYSLDMLSFVIKTFPTSLTGKLWKLRILLRVSGKIEIRTQVRPLQSLILPSFVYLHEAGVTQATALS